MRRNDLKDRTRSFALRVIRLVDALPASRSADVIGRQLIRAATSVGANYWAACRARSPAEFVAKLGIVEEEADECAYWLELLSETKFVPAAGLKDLISETHQLVAITVASIRTARRRPRSTTVKPGATEPQP